MRATAVLAVVVLTVAPAFALEVILQDGAVIVAESYEVVGGYVTIQLPGGGQLAYATEDVDLEATRAGQGISDEPAAEPQRPGKPASLADAAAAMREQSVGAEGSVLSITDADVAHVDPAAPGASADEGEAEDTAPPPGSETGGDVRAVRLNLKEVRQGEYRFTGGVLNAYDFPVRNVYLQVSLSTVGGEDLGQRRIQVADVLEPGASEAFDVAVESATRPRWSVQVFWTQEERAPSPSGQSGPSIPEGRLPTGGGA